ncbi:TetR/AcrR family transcriptional regulator [Aeromonas schubertii]|uniref:TetR/AcrR family transcriptional regulator n=1 Tax=Aeromonas schubertii TaxID=652 RepID=UPI001CC38EA8|nr:TetR/AcrR family transcriptional regulator [Aeromonas schubertii]MBZ6072408.1 TetR/AcrR family transcriptional regulator [Aeromonas schubertii]
MQSTPGRPKGESDARIRLIQAALNLFSRQDYRQVSTRALAREAGVDAALIRYYFGSKGGLFEQMVRETLSPVLQRLRQLPREESPSDLAGFMALYYDIMLPHPGLPRLVVRVLQETPGGEAHRGMLSVFDEIIEHSRLGFDRLLGSRLENGTDPELARLSLVSLMVFPLIAPPVLMARFGLSLTPEGMRPLIEHNTRLLTEGLCPPAATRSHP